MDEMTRRLIQQVDDLAEDRIQRNARIRELETVLGELVRLKDGPRDDAYRAAKDAAWDAARAALPRKQADD